MAFFRLEDVPPSPEQLARARQVQRMAARMLSMYERGRWHPEKTFAKTQGLAQQLDDIDDDLGDAFTPRQRKALRVMAHRLRAYARMVGHRHDHGPGTQLGRLRMQGGLLPDGRARGRKPGDFPKRQLAIGTRHEMEHTSDPTIARQIAMDHLAEDPGYYAKLARMERPVRKRRLTAVPISGWELDGEEDDSELGFLPALVPLISSVAGPLLGGLLGGGDKKAAPAPAPAPAQPPIIVPGGGGGGGPPSNVNLPAIGGVVADQIRAVPPPIRQQVVDAVREIMAQQKAGQMDVADMMKQISTLLGPKLQEQLSSVNQAALQRQATYEHESLKRADQRWQNNADAQRRILARIDEMENKIGTAVVGGIKRRNAVARAFGIPPRYQES